MRRLGRRIYCQERPQGDILPRAPTRRRPDAAAGTDHGPDDSCQHQEEGNKVDCEQNANQAIACV